MDKPISSIVRRDDRNLTVDACCRILKPFTRSYESMVATATIVFSASSSCLASQIERQYGLSLEASKSLACSIISFLTDDPNIRPFFGRLMFDSGQQGWGHDKCDELVRIFDLLIKQVSARDFGQLPG